MLLLVFLSEKLALVYSPLVSMFIELSVLLSLCSLEKQSSRSLLVFAGMFRRSKEYIFLISIIAHFTLLSYIPIRHSKRR